MLFAFHSIFNYRMKQLNRRNERTRLLVESFCIASWRKRISIRSSINPMYCSFVYSVSKNELRRWEVHSLVPPNRDEQLSLKDQEDFQYYLTFSSIKYSMAKRNNISTRFRLKATQKVDNRNFGYYELHLSDL